MVLVGEIGTIDELTDVLAQKKHKLHSKLVVVLNTDNFYEGQKIQLERMASEGFLTRELSGMVSFARTPQEVMEIIKSKI